MGNLKIKILLSLLIISLLSCEKFEFSGFITTYKNVNHRFQQSVEWNNMNGFSEISVPQNNYTILAMGDSHVGGTENLDTFIKNARNRNAAAVVMVGDLTTGHDKDYDQFLQHLPSKDSLMYFPVVGNHDLYFDGWKYFYSLFGSSTYFFVVDTPGGSDLFICLDTGGGTLGDQQINWFKTLLKTKRNNYRHCTVFTHNNLIRLRSTVTTNPMVEEIHVLLDLFTRYKVNMVVTAHDHKRNTAILGTTTHIIMDALQDINDKASYLKLSVNEENIDYNFIEL